MTALLAILVTAFLFVVFAFVGRSSPRCRLDEDCESAGDPTACGACRFTEPSTESNDAHA